MIPLLALLGRARGISGVWPKALRMSSGLWSAGVSHAGDWGPPQPCRGQFGKGPCSPAVTGPNENQEHSSANLAECRVWNLAAFCPASATTGHGHGDESWPQESWDYGNSAASGAVYQQGPHQARILSAPV